MHRILYLFFSIGCILSRHIAWAQVPEPAFANRCGGSGSDYAYALRTYPDGSSVFTGLYSASVTLGGVTYTSQGGSDAFVCKTNANGAVLWTKTLAGPGEQLLSQLAVDKAGNVIVVGEYAENSSFAGTPVAHSGGKDALVAKLDAGGNLVWVKTANNTADADYNEVDIDSAGNVYAFGTFKETLTVGSVALTATGTNNDVLLVKYTPAGEVAWAKKYGNGSDDNALAIWVSETGGCAIAGTFLGTISFGSNTFTTNGLSDIFLARLDASGEPVWSRTYGGTGTDNSFALTGDAAGNLFLSGCFMQTMAVGPTNITSNGLWDVCVAKILPTGDPAWVVSYGGTNNDRANDIQVDAAGNVYLYGWYQEEMVVGPATHTSLGGYDVFLIKLLPQGTPAWSFSFGGNLIDGGAGMDLDAAGNIYMIGDFWSTNFAFGNLNLSPSSGNDIFHVRLGTETTNAKAIEKPEPAPVYTRPGTLGNLEVYSDQPGQLSVVNVHGQLLFSGTIYPGSPGKVPSSGLILYRFSGQNAHHSGKWLAIPSR